MRPWLSGELDLVWARAVWPNKTTEWKGKNSISLYFPSPLLPIENQLWASLKQEVLPGAPDSEMAGESPVDKAAWFGVIKRLRSHVISYARTMNAHNWMRKAQRSHKGVSYFRSSPALPRLNSLSCSEVLWLLFPPIQPVQINLDPFPPAAPVGATGSQPSFWWRSCGLPAWWWRPKRSVEPTLRWGYYRKDPVTQWLFCPHCLTQLILLPHSWTPLWFSRSQWPAPPFTDLYGDEYWI